MKIPQTPPRIMDLLPKMPKESIAPLLGGDNTAPTTYNGEYIHWDKLRHLKPKDGLSVEQWWLRLKFARSAILKPLPLQDKEGKPFRFGMPDAVLEVLYRIDQGAAGRIEMPAQITNPQTRDRFIVSSLMEEAIRSSQLEGAATTRRIAKEMIRSGRGPRTRDEQMIVNNFAAMREIRELRNKKLTSGMIFQLHRILAEKTLDDPSAAGRLRREDEPVRVEDMYGEVLHVPPPSKELNKRMRAMCAFANGDIENGFIHPVVRAMILHFWLAYDHPFVDGNGRCARALFYWSMLKDNYWLCEFISISEVILKAPAQYGRAFLYSESDENDLTYFLTYHLDVITRAIDELHKYISRKMKETQDLEARLPARATFNHRQRELLLHALRQPTTVFTIKSHQRSHGVVYQTARNDLLDLHGQKLLEMHKAGKQMQFSATENLDETLETFGKARA